MRWPWQQPDPEPELPLMSDQFQSDRELEQHLDQFARDTGIWQEPEMEP